jgi:hypothetical protein
MEERSNNRNRWVIAVVVAALAALCCCLLLVAVGAVGWFSGFPLDWGWGPGVDGEEVVQTYGVGSAPALVIDSFSGSITVRAGEGDEIQVSYVKHAPRTSDLDRIEVDIRPRAGGLTIVARNPDTLVINSWVRLEVVVPAGTSFDLHTGSGSIEVRGLRGGGKAETGSGRVTARDLNGTVALHTSSGHMSVETFDGDLNLHVSSGSIDVADMKGTLDAHTSSGSIDVRDAQGWVRLETSSGNIDYAGSPNGDCSFKTGSGDIDLRLPSDLDAWVGLHTGSGRIRVDYPLQGEQDGLGKHDMQGTIGSGRGLTINARTSSGSITLRPQ